MAQDEDYELTIKKFTNKYGSLVNFWDQAKDILEYLEGGEFGNPEEEKRRKENVKAFKTITDSLNETLKATASIITSPKYASENNELTFNSSNQALQYLSDLTGKKIKVANSESLVEIFMKRDELTKEEAEELVDEMKQRVADGENPEEVLYDEGLEPDYIFELI